MPGSRLPLQILSFRPVGRYWKETVTIPRPNTYKDEEKGDFSIIGIYHKTAVCLGVRLILKD